MGISEKTVELNVSRVVIEKCRRTHRRPAYAMGLTQDQEATMGADVFVEDATGWTGGFIQYKAMHRQATGAMRWNLNRTTHRDQHSLLCILEDAGYPVFYCFPKFDHAAAVSAWTPPSLWEEVFWVRPNAIKVPSPVDTHHHVEYSTAGVWTVASEEPRGIPEEAFVSFEQVEAELLDRPIRGALSSLLRAVAKDENATMNSFERYHEALNDVTRGLNIFGFGPARTEDEQVRAV